MKKDEFDTEIDDDGVALEIEEKDMFDKALDWCKNHKFLCVCGVIFFPITLIVLGAKLFSTHTVIETQVEVAPPSCTDGLKKVPMHTETTTYYAWIPEDETPEK